MKGRKLAFWIALSVTLGSSWAARSQEAVREDDKAKLERLEQQSKELMETIKRLQAKPAGVAGFPTGTGTLTETDVQKIVGNYLQTVEQKKAQETAAQGGSGDGAAASVPPTQTEEGGYRVGTLTGLTGKWESSGTNGYGFWFKTQNNDFTVHPGFWFHYDNVFFNQSQLLRAPQSASNAGLSQSTAKLPYGPQGVISGDRLGGVGDLEDGTYFRKIRPFIEGTLWDIFEYRLVLALDNDQFSTSGLDEFWVGANQIPIIGTIRAGHVKYALGLEGDMTASSRTMTFLERSSLSEAIYLNQNFVIGASFHNSYLDDRATYTFVLGRSDPKGNPGVFFGDGQWGYQGRLTALPFWDADGRCFAHLGVSGGWRAATNSAPGALKTIALSARPELRDDDPAAQTAQPVPNSNDATMVNTGALVADHCWITGLEFFSVLGPFSVQAEYGWNFVDGVRGVISPGAAGQPPTGSLISFKGAPEDFQFSGGYVQLSYILTGESRGYDKIGGTLSRDYFGGKGPFTNAWLTWGEDRRLNWGWGAWELAARYSYLNLNDGIGMNRIQGGVMNGFTAGLNWYLNSAVKIDFDYVYAQRSDVPSAATTGTPPTLTNSTIPGFVGGLGMRVQISF